MDKKANGRHCSSCNHTVIDFIQMGDATVLAHQSRCDLAVCGCFMNSQLERDLVGENSNQVPLLKYFAQIALPARSPRVKGMAGGLTFPKSSWGVRADAVRSKNKRVSQASASGGQHPDHFRQAAHRNLRK
jgi:hypothetical protein